MIAICPSCHEAVHSGKLAITDAQIYEWKGIPRQKQREAAHIYVEPANTIKIMTGSVCIQTPRHQAIIFELSPSNRLSFRILDGDILLLNASLLDTDGLQICKIVDNHARAPSLPGVLFESRPGCVRITVPETEKFVQPWLKNQMRLHDPNFVIDGRIIALEIIVLKPGFIKIKGCWPDGDVGIVITENHLSFCRRGGIQPVSLVGHGEETTLLWEGPITQAIFGFRLQKLD